jgi:hypothetical protein
VFLRNALLWIAGDREAPLRPAPRDPERGPLLDAAESDLAPRLARNADAFVPPPRPAPGPGPRPLAGAFAAAAAGALLLEWLLFLAIAGAAAPRRESLAPLHAPS